MGDLLQPAGPDAIDAVLVSLHVLVGDAERIGQLPLAHCKHHAAHPHPAADVPIGGFGAFFRGNCKRTAMADRSLKL